MGHKPGMARKGTVLVAAIAMLSALPVSAESAACLLCEPSLGARDEQPLRIELQSGLQFSRLGLLGRVDGQAEIDPQTGHKRVDGNMVDLGGLSYRGRARVTGEPLRPVRVELPTRVRLHSPDGAEAELGDFETDLPPVPMLDENGVLEFSFGARLSTRSARGGHFRGRIAVRVDYY